MYLTKEQQGLLDGKKGEIMAKVMKTLVMYGDAFDAQNMEPITGQYGHYVTSAGMSAFGAVYEMLQQLIDSGSVSSQPFTADPRPIDPKVPLTEAQAAQLKEVYSSQEEYETQLRALGLLDEDAFTCTCYMDEVGNIPQKGEILSWAESSAVVYANSVLGARCNRNSGIIELFGSIAGFVPYFGLLTDEGRRATWVIEVKTSKLPEAQLLGSAIGIKVMEEVPFIKGLDKYLGNTLTDEVKDYLKDMGAATASNGAVGLYHVEGLTPEAIEPGNVLITREAKTYVIDDAELNRVRDSYPCIWKNPESKPEVCLIGCPHLSLNQLKVWTDRISEALKNAIQKEVTIPTIMSAAPAVIKAFEKTEYAARLKSMGVVTTGICPVMYMSNPLCKINPVVTNSNKLRTYSTARYHTDEEVLGIITKGV